MSSNLILLIKSILIVALCISHAKATEINLMDNSRNIEQFNSWSSLLAEEFKYESIKKLGLKKDYVIVTQLNTDPLEMEVFIVEDSRITYISSVENRKFVCNTNKDLGLLNLIIASRISEIEDNLVELHPFYTIIETRKDAKISTYSFKSFHNSPLRKEIDRIEGVLFRKILNNCNSYSAESFSNTK